MKRLLLASLFAFVSVADASETTFVRSDGSVIKTTDTPRPQQEYVRTVEVKDPTAYYKCMDAAVNHHLRSRRYELMEKCGGIEV